MEEIVFLLVRNPYVQLTRILGGVITLGGFIWFVMKSASDFFTFFGSVLRSGVKSARFSRNRRYARLARLDVMIENSVVISLLRFCIMQMIACAFFIVSSVVTFTKLRQYELLAILERNGQFDRDIFEIQAADYGVLLVSILAGFVAIFGIWVIGERFFLYSIWVRRLSLGMALAPSRWRKAGR